VIGHCGSWSWQQSDPYEDLGFDKERRLWFSRFVWHDSTVETFKSKFFDDLLKWVPLNIEQLALEHRKELNEVSRNSLFDLEGPRSISRTPLPKELWYQRRLFSSCAAIYKSSDALSDIEIYVRRFPYRGTRVSPTTHLRHSLELYLQEAYVLRQRMIDFLNVLQKDYEGTFQGRQLAAVNQPLCRMLKDSLSPIMKARTEHVHGGGFDDDRLRRIDGLELLARHGWQKNTAKDKRLKALFNLLYETDYKKERKRWVKFIQNWNAGIEKMHEGYFELLHPIIFNEEGKFVFPPIAEKFSD
jgi:hypothetical protein